MKPAHNHPSQKVLEMLLRTVTVTAALIAFASLETVVPWAAALNWFELTKWTIGLGIVCLAIPLAVFKYTARKPA